MTTPGIELMVGDKELRAIGHVAAQWAYLEVQIDGLIDVLIKQPATKNLGIRVSQSFKRRIETLRTAAKEVLQNDEEQLSELMCIATDASSLRGVRDDLVHGLWKLHREKGRGPLTTGIRVKRGYPVKIRDISFTAEQAEAVAAKISQVNWRLMVWCMNNVGQE